ncbi:hypothetical protein ACJJIL_04910 [Microbulbifer sp. EKSA005]|uniref:hypothetical protein n=1 Tax=Microbulbifer sp. EKSA005 TaxID=3243364 RepID=UPI004042C6DF
MAAKSPCGLDAPDGAPLRQALCFTMNRALVTVVSLLASFSCSALSIHCGPQDDSFEKYASEVDVKYIWDTDVWAILIRAPLNIDGLPFGLVNLHKGKDGSVFSAHLRTYENEGKIEAHFYANEATLEGMSLWVSYGEQCPQGFNLPLKHNKALKRDKVLRTSPLS